MPMAPIDLFATLHTVYTQLAFDQLFRYFFGHDQTLLWVLCHEFVDLLAEGLA